MPVADSKRPAVPVPSNDTERNQRTADILAAVLADSVESARRHIARIISLVDDAPGNKAAVFALLTSNETEADTILTKLLDLANTHKATGDADLSAPS